MRSRSSLVLLITIPLLVAAGCSSQNDAGASSSGAGSSGSGSLASQGGSSASASSSGGATSSGGVTSSAGGSSSAGKSSSSLASSGGAGSGGTSSSASSGGSTGGSSTSGGNGGASVKGGTSATGGGSSKGGTSGTGGKGGASGGSASQGGTTGSGTTGSGGGTGSGTCPTEAETKFSTFLTSYAALQADSKTTDGYGGDLGGLTGADAICQRIAEKSSACQKSKTWRAFLSTPTVNAKDRIGKGPWYDRLGRIMAANLENLLTERPTGADAAIANDWPNESGIPNHNPDKTGLVDNHEILTGTGVDGKVYTQSATGGGTGGTGGGFPGGGFPMGTDCGPSGGTWSVEAATCWGWTTKEPKGCPRVGHSWPRQGSGIGWISVWNESGCAPGGTLTDDFNIDVASRKVGSAGGYGGFYCFAVTGQ